MNHDFLELPELVRIEPEGFRDRWDRPKLPHPRTGEEAKGRTRASTMGKAIEDTYNLDLWKQRNMMAGVARHADLRQLAAVTPLSERQTFIDIGEMAMERTGTTVRRNKGSALHGLTAIYDAIKLRGDQDMMTRFAAWVQENQPDMWADLVAYGKFCTSRQLTFLPDQIERMGYCVALDSAGSWDRIGHTPLWGRNTLPRLIDLKTGDDHDIEYAWLSWCAQLAPYAFADVVIPIDARKVMERGAEAYERMPTVDRDHGLIISLPYGSGRVEGYEINIRAGYELAKLAQTIRDQRKRKDLAVKWAPEVVTEVSAVAIEVNTGADQGVPRTETVTVSRPMSTADKIDAAFAFEAAPERVEASYDSGMETPPAVAQLAVGTAVADLESMTVVPDGLEAPAPAPRKRTRKAAQPRKDAGPKPGEAAEAAKAAREQLEAAKAVLAAAPEDAERTTQLASAALKNAAEIALRKMAANARALGRHEIAIAYERQADEIARVYTEIGADQNAQDSAADLATMEAVAPGYPGTRAEYEAEVKAAEEPETDSFAEPEPAPEAEPEETDPDFLHPEYGQIRREIRAWIVTAPTRGAIQEKRREHLNAWHDKLTRLGLERIRELEGSS